MELLLVGIGGALGSVARFALGRFISAHSKTTFPRGTFAINITGAMLLGMLVAFQNTGNRPAGIYLLLGDGFLGAYTTFSTFMYEGFSLIQDKDAVNASIYIVASLVLGILGFAFGFKIIM